MRKFPDSCRGVRESNSPLFIHETLSTALKLRARSRPPSYFNFVSVSLCLKFICLRADLFPDPLAVEKVMNPILDQNK